MAKFIYTPAKQKLAKGTADFDILDVRAILVMTNTTADTDQDAATVSAIGTLDEMDGAGYTEIDLANVTVVQDDPNNRSEISYDPGSFGAAVANGTRQVQAIVYYVFVDGNPANDWPVGYTDEFVIGSPFSPGGAAVNHTPDAQGLIQVT